MSANKFKINNSKNANDLDEFYNLKDKNNNIYKKILYMNDEILSTNSNKITFTKEEFIEISFSKTLIKNVKFFDCNFIDCLFLNTTFENCTFSNCTFLNTNTLGSEWIGTTSIDPKVFSKNFDFINDSNIATKLFVNLMKLYEENHQQDREKDARYLYLKSTKSLIHYHYKITKDIDKKTFYLKMFSSWFLDKLSGYGIYKGRLLKILTFYLIFISCINYIFQDYLFSLDKLPYSFMDTLYFSFVTITTIGYGDITPATGIGQLSIIIESGLGILLIALSLNMCSTGK